MDRERVVVRESRSLSYQVNTTASGHGRLEMINLPLNQSDSPHHLLTCSPPRLTLLIRCRCGRVHDVRLPTMACPAGAAEHVQPYSRQVGIVCVLCLRTRGKKEMRTFV